MKREVEPIAALPPALQPPLPPPPPQQVERQPSHRTVQEQPRQQPSETPQQQQPQPQQQQQPQPPVQQQQPQRQEQRRPPLQRQPQQQQPQQQPQQQQQQPQRQPTDYPLPSPSQSPSQTSGEAPSPRQPIKIDVLGEQSDGKGLAAALPAIVTIPPEALSWVAVFGEHSVRYLFSGDWKEREQSLAAVIRQLGDRKFQNTTEPSLAFATVMQLLAGALREKIVPVYLMALELFNTVMAVYSSRLRADVLHFAAEALVKQLVHRCGNNNARISECSLQALLVLAAQPNFGVVYLGPFAIAPILKKAADGTSANAQMVGRLDLVHALLATFNSTRGLSLQDVLLFTRTALDLPDDKVRNTAIKVVAELYRLKRMAGDVLDPQKALGQLKPSLLQVLNRKFAEVDELLRSGGVAATWGGSTSYDGRPLDDLPATANGVRVFAKALTPPNANAALAHHHFRANAALSPLSLGGVGPIGGYNSPTLAAQQHLTLPNASSASPYGQNSAYANRNSFLTTVSTQFDETGAAGGNVPRYASPSRLKFPQSPSIKGRATNGEVSLPSLGPKRGPGGESPLRGVNSGMRASNSRLNVLSEDGRDLSLGNNSPGVRKFRESLHQDQLRVSYAGSTVLDDTDEGLIEYILNDETLLI
ncbi:MAG: hypothetical protein WDW38_006961 [Sanguina aurantia]